MNASYIIIQRDGVYEAKIEVGRDGKQSFLESYPSASVLYKGTLSDSGKIIVVLDVVNDANITKTFDPKVLEERLTDSIN